MDISSLNLQSSHPALFFTKASHCERRNLQAAERTVFSFSRKADFRGWEDGYGLSEIRLSKRNRLSSRFLGVRASGKKNHKNSGNTDRPIPEGGNSEGKNRSNDDAKTRKPYHMINDWRTFRANLVAQEQTQFADDDAAVFDKVSKESAKKFGLKWAHPISAPEAGCVLVATEKLNVSDTFERAVVVLLTKDQREGPFGVIINRPLDKKIKDMDLSNIDLAATFSECSLHFGGPLGASMFLLKTSENLCHPCFEQVIPGLSYGARNSLDIAGELLKIGIFKPKDFRFFVGYSGWQFDQLKKEIESGYWYVAACSVNLINGGSQDSSSNLWEEILQLMGGRYSELSRKPKQDSP